jgi:hypothetical protein
MSGEREQRETSSSGAVRFLFHVSRFMSDECRTF